MKEIDIRTIEPSMGEELAVKSDYGDFTLKCSVANQGDGVNICKSCVFSQTNYELCNRFQCCGSEREDKKDVIFLEI